MSFAAERDMLEIVGKGQAFWETGTEGVIWSVLDDDPQKTDYDGLYPLEGGDRLTVFDADDQSRVIWSGVVDLEFETNRQRSLHNPNYVAQVICNHWVHGLQRGVDAGRWAGYFVKGHPMRLERACGWESFHRSSTSKLLQKGTLRRLTTPSADGCDLAVLSITDVLEPTSKQATQQQKYFTAMTLSGHDLRDLRDACDAILQHNDPSDRA